MKLHILLMVGIALSVTACAKKEQAAPAKGGDTQMAAKTTAPEPMAAEKAIVGSEAFIRHMHVHARQLDDLNAALADGDLSAAQTPAYWLSRHEGVSWPVDAWQPYIKQMRDAATEVTFAPDLGSARVAARRIAEGCRGCHKVAGVEIANLGSDQTR